MFGMWKSDAGEWEGSEVRHGGADGSKHRQDGKVMSSKHDFETY